MKSLTERPKDDPQKIVENGYDIVEDRYRERELDGSWPRLEWLDKLLSRVEPEGPRSRARRSGVEKYPIYGFRHREGSGVRFRP